MIELPLVFLGGLLGSATALACAVDSRSASALARDGFADNLHDRSIYTVGRIFTYAFFGVVAGYAGWGSRVRRADG